MFTSRRVGAALFGAFVGAWTGRAVFNWLLDVGGTQQLILIVATALAGAVVCVVGALAEESERR